MLLSTVQRKAILNGLMARGAHDSDDVFHLCWELSRLAPKGNLLNDDHMLDPNWVIRVNSTIEFLLQTEMVVAAGHLMSVVFTMPINARHHRRMSEVAYRYPLVFGANGRNRYREIVDETFPDLFNDKGAMRESGFQEAFRKRLRLLPYDFG